VDALNHGRIVVIRLGLTGVIMELVADCACKLLTEAKG